MKSTRLLRRAAEGLKKIPDRIEDAVALAKAVGSAIQAAVAVAS